MKLSTLMALTKGGRGRLLSAFSRLSSAVFKLAHLAGALQGGVAAQLHEGPKTFAELTDALEIGADGHEAFAEWLDVGVKLGVLGRADERFTLASRLARIVARPENDPFAALVIETITLHVPLLYETPARLGAGRPFTLDDQDGALIARSSRVLEAFVAEAVLRTVPAEGALRLLEIGCGSGVHLRTACARNPALTARGLELQPEVAARARENIVAWGLADRVSIEVGDVRELPIDGEYDLATLHQNIYYFPVAERAALLARVRDHLAPGGRVLVTTGGRGKTAPMGVLSLWGAATRGAGRLPDVGELEGLLAEAGFRDVEVRNLMSPLDRFYAAVGTK